MNESLISGRYAKALLSYSKELGEQQALYERMHTVLRTCSRVPQLCHTLASPVVKPSDKEQIILAIDGEGAERSYKAFARLVVENSREDLIAEIARSYMRLYREVKNISVINLIAAKPMPDIVYERIRKEVEERTHGTVEFAVQIDESIEGGFILQIDDLRLDASVKGQLDRIKRRLISKAKSLV